MNRLQYFFNRLFQGRNGTDAFSRMLIYCDLFVIFINLFLRLRFLNQLILFITVYVLYRMFSRNQYARNRENQMFLNLKKAFHIWIKRQLARIRDFRTYRYRTCPFCKSYLKLPKKIGKHTAVCPRCKQEFQVTVRI